MFLLQQMVDLFTALKIVIKIIPPSAICMIPVLCLLSFTLNYIGTYTYRFCSSADTVACWCNGTSGVNKRCAVG